MSSQTSSNSEESRRDNDYDRKYHGVIVSYNYYSGSGVIEFLDDYGTGPAKRRASFRREYVLVSSDYVLNVGEEVIFDKDRESSKVRLKNIIPIGLEERVREVLRLKALEASVLVRERLAKLRRRK